MNKKTTIFLTVVLVLFGITYYFGFLSPQNTPSNVGGGDHAGLTKEEICYVQIRDYTTLPNPSSVFCECMGGIISTTEGGEEGCIINNKNYNPWNFFDQSNPYDNSYSPTPIGYSNWKKFCIETPSSVYCENYK